MKNTRYLTEGAVLLALFAVMLLVSLYIPLIGGLFSLLLGVPFLIFTARHGWKNSILFFAGSLVLTGLFGAILLLPVTFAFGLGGAVIGELYKREKSRYSILLGGTVIFSVNLVLMFVITNVFANINMLNELQVAFEESMSSTEEMLRSLGQAPSEQQMQLLKESFQTLQYLLPSFLVILGFILAFVTQWSAAPILRKLGYAIEKFPPLRSFKLPKSVLWYYLLVLVLSFLEIEKGSFFYISVLNIATILQLLMVVQGYAFLFYYFHKKSVGKLVPIIIVIITLALPFFLQFIRILGIIDLGFDLRNQRNKK
ncbi:YybS family protein [Priestia abyssalis]|uniref:YybS family protein n=1 Tax=Priestia abyssalis TaxID=1221450 RepID=UPI000994D534|nr:YybS family protein [Priestia abyssalis]